MNRRSFLKTTASAAALAAFSPSLHAIVEPVWGPYRLSLAEWSFHNSLEKGKMTHLDFPMIARKEFGIDCIEVVDQFFADKANDVQYLKKYRTRADNEGVRVGLLMVDTNGRLGAASAEERQKAIDATKTWIEAGKYMNCLTVRINAYGEGTPDELRDRLVESCSPLADFAAARNMNLVIENHGELSSDPVWLTSLIKAVNKANFGTLPDFGNFPDTTNKYDAVEMMMPHAKAVSAKAMKFTAGGLVEETDFFKMMRIVRDGGYHGYVGIETEVGTAEEEHEAIRATRDLLLWVHGEESKCKPVFNEKNLYGWIKMEGGDWTIENGVLTGRNGQNWSTDPAKSGSWLRTRDEHSDFRLELQYKINQGGNSGVFFRSALEKNPAFTGFEVQIYDSPGTPPTKTGPGSLYDFAAPTKNNIRPAGQWNTMTLNANGDKVRVEINHEKVLEATVNRARRGYIGLQNHDSNSVVQFRNIRIEDLS